jgi:AGZA family xanthine/uracil permease-like MFS transporter
LTSNSSPKWFVAQDLDGFFGLAIDNLVQLIVIVGLCTTVCGMPEELVMGRILPGAALSIILGNLFYAWQALRLMQRTGRSDVTALPYGINTPSVFAYIFLVIAPVYRQTGDPELAWKVGLVAAVGSGVIEFVGAFAAEWIRRNTPRAALLSTLAGIAVTFISMEFALQIFDQPLIAFVPFGILLLQYLTGLRYPYGIPGGLLAVIFGTAIAWISTGFGSDILDRSAVGPAFGAIGLRPPDSSIGSILEAIRTPAAWGYFSVILPMGLFNVVGSLQNIESAEAEGDSYSATSSLAVNGIGTLVGAAFGSCFPTTIYIGHPGWKRLGARAGYSIYNAIFIGLICFAGFMPLVLATVPLEAGVGVVLWIGIIITAQAFQATPKEHAPAVAIGLFPAVAAWGLLMINNSLSIADLKMEDVVAAYEGAGTRILGMIHLSQGFILACMIWSAAAVAIVEKKFATAAVWMGSAAVLSCVGLIHAFQFQGGFVANKFGMLAAPKFAAAYGFLAVLFYLFGKIQRGGSGGGAPLAPG